MNNLGSYELLPPRPLTSSGRLALHGLSERLPRRVSVRSGHGVVRPAGVVGARS